MNSFAALLSSKFSFKYNVYIPCTVPLTRRCIKPKFHYADFHRNFAGNVVDTNHESRKHKLSRQVPDKVADIVAKRA